MAEKISAGQTTGTNTNLTRLKEASTWMYQIQSLDRRGAITALAKTDYPLLVLEPTLTVKGNERFNTKRMLRRLRWTPQGKRRVILAYVDIGEAERFRTYWKSSWRAPSGGNPGTPNFILTEDPDGWRGVFPVAYWDKRWQNIWLGNRGIVRRMAKLGFDGIYMDWVEAYDDETVKDKARRGHINAAKEMVTFIRRMRRSGRRAKPNFLVVGQNAPYLINKDFGYARLIDALAVEDTWFRGEADVGWKNPDGGDIKNRRHDKYSAPSLLKQYRKYARANVPIFSVDYSLKTRNANRVYNLAAANGLRALVTRVALSRVTRTPPP